jgi:hypothetical protein
MFKAPAIYFPSTVVFLDDDQLYAKMIMKRMECKEIKHYESPEFLLKQEHDDFLFVNNDMFLKDNSNYVVRNLEKLKISGNLISVVVSDLHMENISGTEIFSRLSSPFIGRILVSNFMDYQTNPDIIDSRNNGQVDISLDKTKDFVEKLTEAITAAKSKFFTALSNLLYPDAGSSHPLSDTEFARFYLSKIDELKPKEIIPNSSFTKFIFVGDNNEPNYILYVSTEKEILDILASSAAETASADIIPALASGKYMLCHNEADDVLPEGKLWPLFLRPAKQFNGKNTKFFYHISEAQYDHGQSDHQQKISEHRL